MSIIFPRIEAFITTVSNISICKVSTSSLDEPCSLCFSQSYLWMCIVVIGSLNAVESPTAFSEQQLVAGKYLSFQVYCSWKTSLCTYGPHHVRRRMCTHYFASLAQEVAVRWCRGISSGKIQSGIKWQPINFSPRRWDSWPIDRVLDRSRAPLS